MAIKTSGKFLLAALIFLHIHCGKGLLLPGGLSVVYNMGIPGNTSADLVRRLNKVIDKDPGLVIIMVGTNDAAKTDDISVYRNNLANIIGQLHNNGSAILLLTPPPILAGINALEKNTKLQLINKQIDSLGKATNCYVLNINGIFKDSVSAGVSITIDDGLHPNMRGYKIIAKSVYDYIIANGIKKATIVCYGDSITWGAGYGYLPEQTYPGILQRLLNE
jgi:lysophospholipase L1-like esterase